MENCAEDKTKVEKKQKKISVKGNAKDKTHAIEAGKGSVASKTSRTAATDEEEIGDEWQVVDEMEEEIVVKENDGFLVVGLRI